jgi:hypothetical protein
MIKKVTKRIQSFSASSDFREVEIRVFGLLIYKPIEKPV